MTQLTKTFLSIALLTNNYFKIDDFRCDISMIIGLLYTSS